MKTLNINAENGFVVAIEEIQFFDQSANFGSDGEKLEGVYNANVGVKCGDSGIVLICLSGNNDESTAEWPNDGILWSDEDAAFQEFIEEHYAASEFLDLLETQLDFENNYNYLNENGVHYQ